MVSVIQKLKKLKDYKGKMNQGIKDQIIVEYAPLVKFIAQKIASRLPSNIELDDLISCGVIGLMDAIDKYDPSRDNKFKTYAEFRIRGSILDELRSQDWVPRSVREKAKIIEKTYVKLEGELGRPASDEEMCKSLNLNLEEFHDLIKQSKSISLLNIDDVVSFAGSDKKLMASLMDERRSLNPLAAVTHQNMQEVMKDAIKELPEKQRLVLSLYYYEDLNLKEIGQVLDVTESRVSQLHTQAILKVRAKLRHELAPDDDMAA